MPQFLTWRGMQSARDSGYKSTTYALAELIDNAFDWKATKCRIIFIEQEFTNGGERVAEIIIVDNGTGMSESVQNLCLAMGGGENHEEQTRIQNKRIGKFGMGLPQASISQCRKTDVYSWQESNKVNRVSLDFDEIEKNQSIDIPPIVNGSLPNYFENMGITAKGKSGTIVVWSVCDRLSNVRAETLIRKSKALLGKIYRYLLEDGSKSILLEYYTRSTNGQYTNAQPNVEDTKVIPNDPLYLMQNTAIETALKAEFQGTDPKLKEAYGLFINSDGSCLPTSEKLMDHCHKHTFEWAADGPLKTYSIEITTSVAHEKIQKPNIPRGGRTKVGAWYQNPGCNYRNYHNISFVRSGREIHSGRFQVPIRQGDVPEHRWWHIELKFDSSLDDLLGVAWNKQAVGFVYTDESPAVFDEYTADIGTAREQFHSNLSNVIFEAYKSANALIKSRSHEKPINPDTGGLNGENDDTTTTTVTVDGISDDWTTEKKQEVADRLLQKFSDVDKPLIIKAVNNISSRKMPSILIYREMEGPQCWDVEQVQGFPIISVNMNHPFYTDHIQPLREEDPEGIQVTGLELLIKALSFQETKTNTPAEQDIISDFRDNVGLKLKAYLRANAGTE